MVTELLLCSVVANYGKCVFRTAGEWRKWSWQNRDREATDELLGVHGRLLRGRGYRGEDSGAAGALWEIILSRGDLHGCYTNILVWVNIPK